MIDLNGIVNDAVRALLYEVSVNPKPGLVDPISSGPHSDMDIFTFIDSALSMKPYLMKAAQLGHDYNGDLSDMFLELREYGKLAEAAMLKATKNINTHKGAIFSLGILVCATSYSIAKDGDVREIVQEMLKDLTKKDFLNLNNKPQNELTAGELQYLRFNYKGIRGEAESGYPTVFNVGLPALCNTKGTLNQRLLDTFLNLVAVNEDSNLLKRSGNDLDVIYWARKQAKDVLELGGCKTMLGMQKLEEMNKIFLKRNLSLGGTADLLILTIFLSLRKNII